MDGDAAPLAALAEIAQAQDAILVVDEAHAFGALGPGGRGLCAQDRVEPDVLVGTLGKALGAAGGFVAGTRLLRDFLVNRARTFIFTTALPPAVAAAAHAALDLVAGPEGMTTLFVTDGVLQFFDDAGDLDHEDTVFSRYQLYLDHCAAVGREVVDLVY